MKTTNKYKFLLSLASLVFVTSFFYSPQKQIISENTHGKSLVNNNEFEFDFNLENIVAPIGERIVLGTYKCSSGFEFKKAFFYKVINNGKFGETKILDPSIDLKDGVISIGGSAKEMEINFQISVEINKIEISRSSMVHATFVPKTKATFSFFQKFEKHDYIVPGMKIPFAEIDYNINNLNLEFSVFRGKVESGKREPLTDNLGNKINFSIEKNSNKEIVFYEVPKGRIDYEQNHWLTICLLCKDLKDDLVQSIFTDRINLEQICPNKNVHDTEIFESKEEYSMSMNYYSENFSKEGYDSFQDEEQLAFSYNFTLKDKIALVTSKLWDGKKYYTALPLFDGWVYDKPSPSYLSDSYMNYFFDFESVKGWKGILINEKGEEIPNWKVDHLEFTRANHQDPHISYDKGLNHLEIESWKQFGYMTVGVYIKTPKSFIKDANFRENQKVNLIIGDQKNKFVLQDDFFDLSYNQKESIVHFENLDSEKYTISSVENNPKYEWCDYLKEYKQTDKFISLSQDPKEKKKKILNIFLNKNNIVGNSFTIRDRINLIETELEYDIEKNDNYVCFEVYGKVKDEPLENYNFGDYFIIENEKKNIVYESQEKINFVISKNDSKFSFGNTWMSTAETKITSAVTFVKEDFCYNDNIHVDFLDSKKENVEGWSVQIIDQGTFKIINLIPEKIEEQVVSGFFRIYKNNWYICQTEIRTFKILAPKVSYDVKKINRFGTFENGVNELITIEFENLSTSMVTVKKDDSISAEKWNDLQAFQNDLEKENSFSITISIYQAKPSTTQKQVLRDVIYFDIFVLNEKIMTTNEIQFSLVRPNIKINYSERKYSLWDAKQINAGILETYGVEPKNIKFFIATESNPNVWINRTNIDDANSWTVSSERVGGISQYNININHVGLMYNRNDCFMKVKIMFDNAVVFQTQTFSEWVTQ